MHEVPRVRRHGPRSPRRRTHARLRWFTGRVLGGLRSAGQDEMTRFCYPAPAHRLVVDAYMASPTRATGRTGATVNRCSFTCGRWARDWLWSRRASSRSWPRCARLRFPAPVPTPDSTHPAPVLNLNSVEGAPDLSAYTERAWEWAGSVWDAWSHQHDRILASLREAKPVGDKRSRSGRRPGIPVVPSQMQRPVTARMRRGCIPL